MICSQNILPIQNRLKDGLYEFNFDSGDDFENCVKTYQNYLRTYAYAIKQAQDLNIEWQYKGEDVSNQIKYGDKTWIGGPSKITYGLLIFRIKQIHDELTELEAWITKYDKRIVS